MLVLTIIVEVVVFVRAPFVPIVPFVPVVPFVGPLVWAVCEIFYVVIVTGVVVIIVACSLFNIKNDPIIHHSLVSPVSQQV